MDGERGSAGELAPVEVETNLALVRHNIEKIIEHLNQLEVVPVRILGINGPVLDCYILEKDGSREFHLGMKHPSMDMRKTYARQISDALKLNLSEAQIKEVTGERGFIKLTEAQFSQLNPRLFGANSQG